MSFRWTAAKRIGSQRARTRSGATPGTRPSRISPRQTRPLRWLRSASSGWTIATTVFEFMENVDPEGENVPTPVAVLTIEVPATGPAADSSGKTDEAAPSVPARSRAPKPLNRAFACLDFFILKNPNLRAPRFDPRRRSEVSRTPKVREAKAGGLFKAPRPDVFTG